MKLCIKWLLIFSLVACGPAGAAEKQVEQDVDGDGVVDTITWFDGWGKILRLDTDTDKDGHMDRFQYYEKERMVRVERDTDADRQIDCIDYFEKGKRTRQARTSAKGEVYQGTLFDEQEQPAKIQKDTTGSGFFDTIYLFSGGTVVSSSRDTNESGTPNILETYENGKPVKRTVDDDEDGRPEQVVLYDDQGLPKESRHDRTVSQR